MDELSFCRCVRYNENVATFYEKRVVRYLIKVHASGLSVSEDAGSWNGVAHGNLGMGQKLLNNMKIRPTPFRLHM